MMMRKLGIETQGWLHDTNVMGFAVDENMLTLNLDDLTRVFVPEMAGYADEFNNPREKGPNTSRMGSTRPDHSAATVTHTGADHSKSPSFCVTLTK